MLIFRLNIKNINFMRFHQYHTHHIYFDSNHVNLNKKYAYSKNKHISNRIDDLTSSTLNYFFQQ